MPNSASDDISPGGDGALTWTVVQGTGVRTKTFKVTVSDTQCTNQRMVNNRAGLLASGYAPVISNVVSHPVTCPPVGFPTTQPPYAEDELQVNPYPLVAGLSSEVSVRLTNSGATPASVSVQFQVNPSGIGIGLPYTTFDTRSATIPAASQIILKSAYHPAVSGLACFQVTVTSPGYAPIKTQTCLDTIEDFSGSPPYPPLNFMVGNPTGAVATIQLVVDNTCPGWTAAVITTPPGGVLTNVGPNSTDLRNVSLEVTPPSPATLGSGCHIDVQGWIINPGTGAAVMIGGIRKLDVPPVHLPLNVQPPWEEPEITFNPDPPVAGVPGQLCIQLANPLAVSKTVTVDFSVADFGAGIGFVPAASMTVTLPPNSLATYCTSWTPIATGTLHRCVLATLSQPGYLPQHSQHNVDIVRPSTSLAGNPTFPFTAGNPDLTPHTLGFSFNLVGINPLWMPIIEPLGGGILPGTIGPGAQLNLQLRMSSAGLAPAAIIQPPLLDLTLGSVHSVEVTLLLDGVPSGGFSVQLAPGQVYLPAVRR